MQGAAEALSGFAALFGCLPLAARDIRVPKKGQALTATLIMLLAVVATAMGLVPVAVSFAAAALAFVAMGVVPLRSVYTAVDWPVILLLGAMLPVADAMASTGAADMIARVLLDNLVQGHAIAGLLLLVVTHVAVGPDEQRGHGSGHVSDCDQYRQPAWRWRRRLFDGGCGGSILCIPYPH